MSNKLKIGVSALVLAIVIVVFGYVVGKAPSPVTQNAAAGTGVPTVYDNVNMFGSLHIGVSTGNPLVSPTYSPCIDTNGLWTCVITGTMPAGSPLVVIANPFNGTSTITFANANGITGTSSVQLLMGTTTSPVASSSAVNILNSAISPSLLNIASISTTSPFSSTAGVTSGSPGYNTPGTGSVASIEIDPGTNIAIMATGTSAGNLNANNGILFPTSTTSINYEIEIQH